MRWLEPKDKPAEKLPQPNSERAVTAGRSQPDEALSLTAVAQMPLGSLLFHVLFGGCGTGLNPDAEVSPGAAYS